MRRVVIEATGPIDQPSLSGRPGCPVNSWCVDRISPPPFGVVARPLIVLRAPGSMAAGRDGSGFISVDNDDPTAATTWALRNEVGLHDRTLMWNIVPWHLDGGAPDAQEVQQGAMDLRRLLLLLPDLRE